MQALEKRRPSRLVIAAPVEDRVADGETRELRESAVGRKGRELAKDPIVPRGRETAIAVHQGKKVSGCVEHVLRVSARGRDGVAGIGNRERGDRTRLHLDERVVHR